MDQTEHFPAPDDEPQRKARLTQMLDEARVWLHQTGYAWQDHFVPADLWIKFRDELVARKMKETP